MISKKTFPAVVLALIMTISSCVDNTNTETSDAKDIQNAQSQSMYPTPILTTKLDIMLWNDVVKQMRNYDVLDEQRYYSDSDMWLAFREYAADYDSEYSDMSDYDFWNTYRSSYLTSYSTSANNSAYYIRNAINNYIENSGSTTFSVQQVCEFDIIGNKCDTFPNIGDMLYQDFGFSEDDVIKVFYQNGQCVGVAYVNGRTEPLITGTDCPTFNELGYFNSFTWNSYGQQINSSFEMVGLYPAP